MQNIILINKQTGETPLEALERARVENEISKDIRMTYAGRLDPMAEGLLLILVGEECKNKEKYLNLNKEYEVEVLFGFATDTGDLLGKVTRSSIAKLTAGQEIQNSKVEEILKGFIGKSKQEYPAFSSKTVEGKPLFAYAKSGEVLDEIPTKEVEIYDIEFIEDREISMNELLDYVKTNIAKVKGDFRQEEILARWKEILNEGEVQYQIMKIKVNCSSGTYMRTLTQKIGEKISIPALAFSIKRTKIGGLHF